MIANKKQTAFIFKYRPAYERSDFIVGKSNYEAVKWIDTWPNWRENGIIVIGPQGSGKSHLVSVWRKKSFGQEVILKYKNNFNEEIFKQKNIAIENLQEIKDYDYLLHIINYISEKGGKILITSTKKPAHLKINLADLSSRLLAYPHAEMKPPSDDVLEGLLIKLFLDRGLKVSKTVVKYILSRIERTYDNAKLLVFNIDKRALEENRAITIPLVKNEIEKFFYKKE